MRALRCIRHEPDEHIPSIVSAACQKSQLRPESEQYTKTLQKKTCLLEVFAERLIVSVTLLLLSRNQPRSAIRPFPQIVRTSWGSTTSMTKLNVQKAGTKSSKPRPKVSDYVSPMQARNANVVVEIGRKFLCQSRLSKLPPTGTRSDDLESRIQSQACYGSLIHEFESARLTK